MVAIVKCGVCMSLQPPPEDLPYPYETSYIPRLENKADVFFRFQDAFERIAKQGNSRGGGGMSEGGGLVPPGQQQQPGGKHDDDDEEDDDEEEMEEMQQGSGEHLLDGLGLDFTALAAGRGNERRSGPDGDAGDDDADEEIDDEEEEEEEQE